MVVVILRKTMVGNRRLDVLFVLLCDLNCAGDVMLRCWSSWLLTEACEYEMPFSRGVGAGRGGALGG